MTEKGRFTAVAVVSAAAGVIITAMVDRFAMKQDLEFLGIVHHDVQEGVEKLRKQVEGESGDDNAGGS
jgi:hypothetical protein